MFIHNFSLIGPAGLFFILHTCMHTIGQYVVWNSKVIVYLLENPSLLCPTLTRSTVFLG